MARSERRIEEILDYWFGSLSGPHDIDDSRSRLWWTGGDDIDEEVRERFGVEVSRAFAGDLDGWQDSPRGALALVILLDQFTRNIGRGTADAFIGDRAALAVSQRAIERGLDRELRLIERAFLYMPMMHAEDREVARRSKEMFAALAVEVAEGGNNSFPDFRAHADQHAGIVLRFGRYPHRNELLGRASTAEELEFLAAGGPTFGQKKKI
jgi:uncharacterized protein (DUF924 family)